MKQGDIHNPESITRMYHYHRSICAFVFYNLTGKHPIKFPSLKSWLLQFECKQKSYSLPCLRLDNGKLLPEFQRKTYLK